MNQTSRQHLRYDTTIPLEFRMGGALQQFPMHDIAEGGLSFVSDEHVAVGKILNLFIQMCKPKFNELVTVEWCKKYGERFLVGVSFRKNTDEFIVASLVEQIFYIEDYCNQIDSSSDIATTREQALKEWLKYH